MLRPSHSDHGAFEHIVADCRGYLLRLATRLSGNRDIAEDLVQETLMRGFQRFDQFEPGTNVRAWLITILTRLFYDSVKHARVVSKANIEVGTTEVPDEDDTTASAYVSDEMLQKAFEQLEPELREAVELIYLKSMSYKETASRLDIPLGTLAARMSRARRKLKEILKT